MTERELQELWQRQDTGETTPPAGTDDVISDMHARLRKLDRQLWWRDGREFFACVVVLICFGRIWTWDLTAISRVGCGVVLVSTLFIAGVMLAARRRDRQPDEPESVTDAMRREARKVARQERLLRNVLWWYILPIFVGVELFQMGYTRPSEWIKGAAVYGAFCGVLWWMNQWVARRQLRPLREQIEQTLRKIEGQDDHGNGI